MEVKWGEKDPEKLKILAIELEEVTLSTYRAIEKLRENHVWLMRNLSSLPDEWAHGTLDSITGYIGKLKGWGVFDSLYAMLTATSRIVYLLEKLKEKES